MVRKNIILSSLLLGLVSASPLHQKRQELPFESYDESVAAGADSTDAPPVGDAVPQTVSTFDPDAVAETVVATVVDTPPAEAQASTDAPPEVITVTNLLKRTDAPATSCIVRTSNGPHVSSPDTPEAFTSYADFATAATDATKAANVPSGYAVVPNFVNLKAVAKDKSYITYTSSKLSFYDPKKCAAICDTMAGCTSFNIYYERVPLEISKATQVPDAALGCPGNADATSATLIKCAFYGMPLVASTATEVYQFQGKAFKVVHAGSTAFTKSAGPSVDGFQGPITFGNNGDASINAPAPVIDHGYLRSQTFGTNVPFSPELCAASCNAQTEYNKLHNINKGQACVFFNAYIFYKNGKDGVFTCAYYGIPYGASFAKNKGQRDNSGNVWTVGSSYGYYAPGFYTAK
ncbi:hypothetical protein B0H65DRAFT_132905 [Neurospora tetraspora]|uniref:Uncharacterized protein n=1 Tax=Neurospora tetraspora TaxID=94610 RepID=A0AAE0JLA6_9PEZI|nr:hypothetical protein B0H65DRAFT_132905 [Neurospora tetraspora]